jgi:drug/metabolite transporter (DMT)-like permease
VGEFTAIVLLTPLIVTLLAARMLHEKVSRLRVLLVAGGFVGTLAIVRPQGANFNWALLFPVGVVIANAGFQLLTSPMTRTEDSMTMRSTLAGPARWWLPWHCPLRGNRSPRPGCGAVCSSWV